MKRILLTFLSVMAFAGMSVAQDVWTSGYYTDANTGRQQAAVYKNATKQYYSTYVDGYYGVSSDLDLFNGDVYWASNAYTASNNAFNDAKIMKNSSNYSSFYGGNAHIYDLYRFPSGSFTLIATGCKTIDGVETAVAWKNSSTDVHRQMGDGTYSSCAYGATGLDMYLYTCGVQYTSSSDYHGVIWKENAVFHSYPEGTVIYDIAHFNGYFYAVGTAVQDGATKLRVWKTRDDGSSDSGVLYTLASSNAYGNDRTKIYVDEAGDIYVTGQESSYDRVWKNGSQLYSTSDFYTSVLANTNGVYYVGGASAAGKVWKDGSVLYSPTDAKRITNIRMDTPTCDGTQVRSLPFTENFENGSTSWPCWTVIDEDGNNNSNLAYWFRSGSRLGAISGNYSARHEPNINTYQKGWLVTPRLFLQPGRDNATLSFKSAIDGSYTIGVYVTTDATPSASGSWTRVVDEGQSSGTQTYTVNLNDYMGEAIYIAFKYTGNMDRVWMIDDVSVTESWTPYSSAYSVPYSHTFNNWNPQSTYWYNVDFDMTGGQKCWKYSESENCAYHPYGQNNGISQYGCLVSPNINLPSGHDYVLKFKTKSASSGSNMANRVYLKRDGTGTPDPNTYTTQIWNDSEFSSSWTEVEIPLTSHAGHTVSFSFEYSGTYAHNWYIKDVRVEQAIAQYTITANANNNSWGTVSGGGTYDAGATCTLTATPASGYQFQSWKKNGTVVSTNPSYSFSVTENATYTAYFGEIPINYFSITTNVTPAGAGTVTGAGTYQEGSSVTLTATANNGYTFDHWQDGNTDNPRTITVTSNATYTATFSQLEYTISVYANPTSGGSVSGGGTFHYGETATLTATPNANYEFAGWNDGNDDNPRTVTVTGNATYTAIFNEVGSTYYTVTTHVNPAEAGTVNGGGTYEEGSVVVLEAIANAGYTFSHWNDGSTSNPRTITVNNDMDFTATFTHNQYTITVVANPTTAGSVSGGGAYYYGDNATLYATAYSGYEFVGWNDGSTENPHTVTVTGSATYTATFSEIGTTYYTVSTHVSPLNSGTVTGSGTYPAGTTATIQAEPNDGYVFLRWNDGLTTNPRTVTVNNNMSFTAYFKSNNYTITANASPTEGGSVTGGGVYAYGQTATLQAVANTGYTFLQWSDGNSNNPRTVTVTSNATYTALFKSISGTTYTVTVTSAQPELGSVFGGGTYSAGMSIQIAAYPNENAHFVRWDDGNTENPRTVTVNGNLSFEAHFAADQTYTIEVLSNNPDMGNAFGGGTFAEGSQIQISAVPFQGYIFTGWDDGNTDNPRTITVTGNATYKAMFSENSVVTHTVTLICNTAEGSVTGGGVYVHGAQAYIQAIPNQGYQFTKWSDESTDNPRIIEVTSDITLAAFFGVGVDENEHANILVYPNPAKESIRIMGIEANSEIAIYNVLGELVKVTNASADEEIGVRELAPGLYLVRCGNVTLRFVKK